MDRCRQGWRRPLLATGHEKRRHHKRPADGHLIYRRPIQPHSELWRTGKLPHNATHRRNQRDIHALVQVLCTRPRQPRADGGAHLRDWQQAGRLHHRACQRGGRQRLRRLSHHAVDEPFARQLCRQEHLHSLRPPRLGQLCPRHRRRAGGQPERAEARERAQRDARQRRKAQRHHSLDQPSVRRHGGPAGRRARHRHLPRRASAHGAV